VIDSATVTGEWFVRLNVGNDDPGVAARLRRGSAEGPSGDDEEVGVGFPENELTSNERVVTHIHPHWKALVGPVAVLVLVLVGLGFAWAYSLNKVVLLVLAVVGLALIVWLTVWPYMKWHATHYVFTNERVITRVGVFGRDMESIPLNRVNDVSSHQTFFDRIFGCGSLTVESAGDHGQDTFKEIPHVHRVARELHELIDPETTSNVPAQSSNDGTTQHLSADRSDS
jgi:uncharacterized membrane protein YdbT with pleckstrin-like domain